MKIRPKEILYAATGVRFSTPNANGANWRQLVFNNYRLHILDTLAADNDDYGYWLNDMQSRHANIYKLAGGPDGNWQNTAYENNLVGQYLHDYKGDQRFGTFTPGENYNYDFNLGITPNYNTRYDIANPPARNSGDNTNKKYTVDNLYSAITDDRRILGREGDWDEASLNEWNNLLKSKGWQMYLDTNDGYYKLKRFSNSLNGAPSETGPVMSSLVLAKDLDSFKPKLQQLSGSIQALQRQDPESKWKIFGDRLKNAAPDILDALRLAGNLHNNQRVYDAVLKGIRPNLLQTYNTYRQVVGDEGTKQAYYRRGIAGQTKAGLAFTSDADRLMAYQMEAKRVADESKAQGDLVDNAEIRRTSDESNQHAWGNIQRATEVANRNLIEMNNANAAKWNLKALKYSADWTNWDNYLMGIQNRWQQKKEEDKAFLRQLASLGVLNDYINDELLNQLLFDRQELFELYQKEGIDATTKNNLYRRILDLNKQINSRKLELEKSALGRMYGVEIAKSGSKIEYKYKKDRDKYLYKTSKDVVEHFRAMSRMSDESRLKSRTKPIKLSDHPKGSSRKYLLGGVAPFTIYRPLGVGGESAISSQTTNSGTSSSKSSGKDEAAKNKLDLVKELFKSLQGLPVDVNTAYNDIYKLFEKSKLFGEEMSTDDIAGIYLNSIRSVNLLKHSLEVFEKAKAFATSLDSLQEYAVTSNGHYLAQDKEGNFTEVKDLKEFADNDLSPITNQLLINMRAYSANMVGLKGDTILENVIGNGMGINKIGAQIKALAGNIGATEGKLEGISQVESGKVKAGLLILAGTAGTPDGHYSVTTYTKDLLSLIQAALRYINNMLSPALKATLEAHGGVELNIMLFLGSQLEYTKELAISPLTGKAAKDANGNSKSGSGTDTPASVLFLLGNGYSEIVEFNIGNSQSVKALGRFGILLDKEKNNLGLGSNFLDVSKSQFGPILDMDKATFGGARLNSNGYSHIILNNSDCIGLDLPVKRDLSGNYVPDFLLLSLIEKAEEQIHNNRITDPKLINKIYKDLGLPEKFDSNGNIILQNYRRFAGILVILDSKALKGGVPLNVNEISEADDTERELFIEAMKKENKDYDLSDGFLWSNWGRDKLYKGTIFVPVREDIVSGYISGGYPLDTDLPNDANKVAIMLYAPKTLLYQKTPPLSSLK